MIIPKKIRIIPVAGLVFSLFVQHISAMQNQDQNFQQNNQQEHYVLRDGFAGFGDVAMMTAAIVGTVFVIGMLTPQDLSGSLANVTHFFRQCQIQNLSSGFLGQSSFFNNDCVPVGQNAGPFLRLIVGCGILIPELFRVIDQFGQALHLRFNGQNR